MSTPKQQPTGAAGAMSSAAYEQYAGALRRYIATRVHRPEEVSDLCQEILYHFVRWRANHTDALRNPLGYLFRIAFRVIEDSRVRRRRDPLTQSPQEMLKHLDGLHSTANDADQAEDLAVQADVIAALKGLPENHLLALMLVEGEGFSYHEAARKTGWKYSTVATYVTHGRAALKLALEGRAGRKGPSR